MLYPLDDGVIGDLVSRTLPEEFADIGPGDEETFVLRLGRLEDDPYATGLFVIEATPEFPLL